tara:strand:+ start:106 stop:267 length:162 start_codon:yes stop_codon:yes gene_type:complete
MFLKNVEVPKLFDFLNLASFFCLNVIISPVLVCLKSTFCYHFYILVALLIKIR